jgi:ATP-dependent DNA ligase
MSLRERTRPGLGIIEPCLPSPAKAPPSGPGWLHEIKHDGFRILARRNGAGVRLLTRNGYDFGHHFPVAAAAIAALPAHSFLIDVPIESRKRMLSKLVRGPRPGIVCNEHYEGDGEIVFQHACQLGCEGIVSKRLGSTYSSGRSKYWVKVKNPKAPGVRREAEEDWMR